MCLWGGVHHCLHCVNNVPRDWGPLIVYSYVNNVPWGWGPLIVYSYVNNVPRG
jgi:hypothetical protein